MRITSIENVEPGDILGQDLFDSNGSVLLKRGVALTQNYIDSLCKLGLSVLYILDNRLEDVKSPMSIHLNNLKGQLAKSFSDINKRVNFGLSYDLKNMNSILSDIIDFIIHNKGVNDICLVDLKTHDNYTYVHSLNTTLLSCFFGAHKHLSKSRTLDMALGAFLHDVGKIDVPLHILNKNGRLSEEEFATMKNHPVYGYDKSKSLSSLSEDTRKVILNHHERMNGSGYPYGVDGSEISLLTRIVSASDVYDALTSNRVYRKAFPHKEAYEHMLAGSGTLFDETIIDLFKSHFFIYPIGIKVSLSNRLEGYVVKNNKGFPDKPVVRIFSDEYGQTVSPYEIDLVKTINICVDSVIS